MTRYLPLILLLAIPVVPQAQTSSVVKDQLEQISQNWFTTGFDCGLVNEAIVLGTTNASLEKDKRTCQKWMIRFHVEPVK